MAGELTDRSRTDHTPPSAACPGRQPPALHPHGTKALCDIRVQASVRSFVEAVGCLPACPIDKAGPTSE